MNFLVLGDGHEEWAWAQAIEEAGGAGHRLIGACPGFKARPDLPAVADLDGALAVQGLDAVVVGGGPGLRAEGLRRAAAAGLAAVALHPPDVDADPYYQVALSRQETGAVVVPDLPGRLHPAAASLREAAEGRLALGAFRSLRYEVPAGDDDLLTVALARAVDLVRSLLGEVEALTATGDPPGDRPTEALVVQLRGAGGRRGEIQLRAGDAGETATLTVVCAEGTLAFEHDPEWLGPSRLVGRGPGDAGRVDELPPWDARAAVMAALTAAVGGVATRPDLLDGTRAVELAEAAGRSLRRGRTIDLHYEEVSEAANFKSVMTSLGCLVIVGVLVVLPLALAGPALGLPWTIYLAYLILPALGIFILLQGLRLALFRGGGLNRQAAKDTETEKYS